ncbi:hypothetical protein [Kitasatospora sp. NPDC050543]|uniref:hypothetical protein n=1 Tax=Kitasatospora sp. NPDC050543 TaxID=3364054 RepID=UPI0037A22C52
MTNLTRLPPPSSLETAGAASGDQDAVDRALRAALERAAEVGERARAWVRVLATRQSEDANRQLLETFADTVHQVLGREIIPGGDGEIGGEIRYRLDAYVILGSILAQDRPKLTVIEQLALVAVGAITTTAPSTVLNDIAADLPALCDAIDNALTLAGA